METIEFSGKKIPFRPVRTGNPHAVIWMAGGEGNWLAPSDFSYRSYGPRIENHSRFPQRTNVEFVRKILLTKSGAEVYVEAWERGAGATLSCGSGAVAVAAEVRRRTNAPLVQVHMTQFKLRIRFEGERAFLSGPCALVASGEFFG
jgi:diaminopimelate epimerase